MVFKICIIILVETVIPNYQSSMTDVQSSTLKKNELELTNPHSSRWVFKYEIALHCYLKFRNILGKKRIKEIKFEDR